jgi:hypothetical protein
MERHARSSAMSTREQAANYRRDCDQAIRHEPDLPLEGAESPPNSGPTPQDLDRAFGIGQRPTSAAQERRVRDTWLK